MPKHWEEFPGSLWAIHSPWQTRDDYGKVVRLALGKSQPASTRMFLFMGSPRGPELVHNAALGLSAGELLQKFPCGLPKSVSQKLVNQKNLRKCEELLIHTSEGQ